MRKKIEEYQNKYVWIDIQSYSNLWMLIVSMYLHKSKK